MKEHAMIVPEGTTRDAEQLTTDLVPTAPVDLTATQTPARKGLMGKAVIGVGIFLLIALSIARRQNFFKDLVYNWAWKNKVGQRVDDEVDSAIGFLPSFVVRYAKKKAHEYAHGKGRAKVEAEIAKEIRATIPGFFRWLFKLD